MEMLSSKLFCALICMLVHAECSENKFERCNQFFEENLSQLEQEDPRLIKAIQDKYLIVPPSKQVKPNILINQSGQESLPMLKAQYGQPFAIEDIFQIEDRHLLKSGKSNRQRVFIEAGAYDGCLLSNSLYFELKLNWTGMLVEPDPKAFEVMKGRNRNSWLLPNCYSTDIRPETAEFDLEDIMAERILEDSKNEAKEKAKVQCLPFFSTLLAIGNPKIDYFSLDVDGPELQILHSIPWEKIDITVFGIEVNHVGEFFPGTLDELRDLMLKQGYKIYQKGNIDEIYVKSSYLKSIQQMAKNM